MTAAASWAGPLARRPAGKRRKARPRKRPLSALRNLTRRAARTAAFELALFGGMILVWGWTARIALGIVIGAVMVAVALVVVTL